MTIDTSNYDMSTRLPKSDAYLEKELPPFLERSLASMKRSW